MAADEKPTNGEATRGLPYYESLKRNIRDHIKQKIACDKKLLNIEDEIYRLETHYLEDAAAGNIIRGFDNYIKGSSASTGGAGTAAARKKSVVQDTERIFSRSSVSLQRESSPDSQTPSHAPTPSNASVKNDSNAPTPTSTTHKSGSSLKRSKKAEKDDEDGDSKPKRLKISFSKGDKGD